MHRAFLIFKKHWYYNGETCKINVICKMSFLYFLCVDVFEFNKSGYKGLFTYRVKHHEPRKPTVISIGKLRVCVLLV